MSRDDVLVLAKVKMFLGYLMTVHFDIVTIIETWLKKDTNLFYNNNGYDTVHVVRETKEVAVWLYILRRSSMAEFKKPRRW